MVSGGMIVNDGKNWMWRKAYGDETGSIVFFKIGVGSTTVTTAQTDLNSACAGSFAFVTGYPTYNTTDKRATVRGFVNSASCNGSSIVECGAFIGNGSMWSRDVFTAISKTGSTELAFIWIDEFD